MCKVKEMELSCRNSTKFKSEIELDLSLYPLATKLILVMVLLETRSIHVYILLCIKRKWGYRAEMVQILKS